MYTSGLLLAFAGLLPSTINKEPIWLEDYGQACKTCQKLNKPLAVFVGSGSNGWNRLSQDRLLSVETKELLAKSYICMYVDAARKNGQELATAFEMPGRLGIVISDSHGQVQAFRHEGDLRTPELLRNLRRYADPERIIVRTESNPVSNPVDEPQVRSVRFANPTYQAPPCYSSFRIGRSC